MKNPFAPTSALGSRDALQSILAVMMRQQNLSEVVVWVDEAAEVEGFWLEEEFDVERQAVVITLVTASKAVKQ